MRLIFAPFGSVPQSVKRVCPFYRSLHNQGVCPLDCSPTKGDRFIFGNADRRLFLRGSNVGPMILEAFQRPMKGQLLRQGLSLDCGCPLIVAVPRINPKCGLS